MTRVLMVEDDRALATHWREVLEAENFHVVHEVSVEGAIQALDEMPFDVVITDAVLETDGAQLTESGGFAVISYIALNIDPAPRILATSGLESHSTFVDRNFAKMSSLRSLRKPISDGQLVETVHELLSVTVPNQQAERSERIQNLIHSNDAMLELLGSTDGVWDWRVGTDEVTFAPGFRKLLGFDGDDVDGFPDTLEVFLERIHPADREGMWASVNKCLLERSRFNYDFRIRFKCGDYIWVRSRATASFDDNGLALRMVGSMHDITETKRLEQKIKETVDRFNWAMTNANIGLWDWNPHTSEVFFSDVCKQQLGFTNNETWDALADWENLLHPDDRNKALNRVAHFRGYPREPYDSTFRLRTATEEYRWIRAIGRGVFGADGNLDRCVGVHLDVDDLKTSALNLQKANNELALANKELERFASVASHDLQEPLRAVGGFLQLLEKDYSTELDEKARGYIQKSVEGAARMSSLINDLLVLSRVTWESVDLSQQVEMSAVIDLACVDLENQIRDTESGLVVNDKLPVVKGNLPLLVQLFRNLIGNAIKYRSKRTPLVEIGYDDKRKRVFICDNGIGIAPEYQRQIFELFKRLHRREDYPGTGLGLAICERIAERHGWSIYVESTVNEGSCFFVQLDADK